jgi:hypothetical protein
LAKAPVTVVGLAGWAELILLDLRRDLGAPTGPFGLAADARAGQREKGIGSDASGGSWLKPASAGI